MLHVQDKASKDTLNLLLYLEVAQPENCFVFKIKRVTYCFILNLFISNVAKINQINCFILNVCYLKVAFYTKASNERDTEFNAFCVT